ncbi:50S ribosomal protein L6 [Candidatus Dependentiae bacterium]|nr:50S ribosomal protein L6 [Candidatus Dependentiae bacterium]
MSRIGKKPVTIPKNIKAKIENNRIIIEGPKGRLEREIINGLEIKIDNNQIVISRNSESKKIRESHGLLRALIANMITGVEKGIEKRLEIVGVGYKVIVEGKNLKFQLGFSHPVVIEPPEGITFGAEGNNIVIISGIDKDKVGLAAAKIKELRPVEPYKGKGLRYVGQQVKIKPGKTGKTA